MVHNHRLISPYSQVLDHRLILVCHEELHHMQFLHLQKHTILIHHLPENRLHEIHPVRLRPETYS